jgi:hypothetical protein
VSAVPAALDGATAARTEITSGTLPWVRALF